MQPPPPKQREKDLNGRKCKKKKQEPQKITLLNKITISRIRTMMLLIDPISVFTQIPGKKMETELDLLFYTQSKFLVCRYYIPHKLSSSPKQQWIKL
jgi:hypothetical protein